MSDGGEPLHYLDAWDLVELVRNGLISAREIVEAHLAQLDAWNPVVGAVCTPTPERALDDAARADDARARGAPCRPLEGVPVGIKDTSPTAGVRTTFGSPIFADHVPEVDAIDVARLKQAGAIVLGKTNTPEFAAGSQTFNEVFGTTSNPYDPAVTAGGSSGGSAAALASGMIALGTGSDLGGSLRNPASFCNVVGLRPSPGRVPVWPSPMAWNHLSVVGPMARSVRDVALMLSVVGGPDVRDPISIEAPAEPLGWELPVDRAGARVAWTPDLGLLPVEREVIEVLETALPALEQLGCTVEEAWPDVTDAQNVFHVLRASALAARYGVLVEQHADSMKPELLWNIEVGQRLGAMDVARAELRRTQLYHEFRRFFERFDFLVLPAAQVVPFSTSERYVRQIGDTQFSSYIDWLGICSVITVTGHPAISVPGGFTAQGLPVGLQIVGPHHGDRAVLELAHAFEVRTGYGRLRPSRPNASATGPTTMASE